MQRADRLAISPGRSCDQGYGRKGTDDDRDRLCERTSLLGSLMGDSLRAVGGLAARLACSSAVCISAKPSSALAIRSLRVSSTATSFVWTWIEGTANVASDEPGRWARARG